jgi:hypothetical protein
MANTYKILGQVSVSSATATTLYTVPASTSSIISTLAVCNQNSTGVSVRVAVRPAGAALDPKHYIVYDSFVTGNDTLFLTLGISLATTDVVTVYSNVANVSFNAFGTEVV